MKIEKLPSGSYRVRKTIDKETYSFVFDHKPTQKDIQNAIENRNKSVKMGKSFGACCKAYIELKSNILSPSTLRGYNALIDKITPQLMDKDIGKISQIDIQQEINLYSANHSPKTTRNFHSFISSVLNLYRPEFELNTRLPSKSKNLPYIPTDEDIKRIIEESEGTMFNIAIRLSCYGLRRSELCALSLSDLQGNKLTIDKVKVQNRDNEWVIKHTTKTTASTRVIYISDELADDIREQGYIFNGYPNSIYVWLQKAQRRLGIPQFPLHKMRHYFASKLSDSGVADADILALGGWETDTIMKSVYRHSMANEQRKREIMQNINI